MTEPPKSPTPGSDWLASVAAENRERDDELERLRAENEALNTRVADLENYIIEFADYVDLHTSCDAWRYQDKAISLFKAVWDVARNRQYVTCPANVGESTVSRGFKIEGGAGE